MANFRSTSSIHCGWLTTDYSCKQATSAFNLAFQFCQLLSNYGVQMEGRSNATGARFIMQSRMFVECKKCAVNQRHWTKVGRRQLVHPTTLLITSVERNCLHGSLWLIQPCWSTWGTRVNAPLASSCLPARLSVRPDVTILLSLDRFSWHVIFEHIFRNLARKFKFH